MTRRSFGGGAADFVALTAPGTLLLETVPSASLTMWTAVTGGSRVTDLLNASAQAVTVVTTDAYGNVPPFSGPADGTAVLYADAGGGARVALHATDTEGRVAALEAVDAGQASQTALTAEASARAAADSAAASALAAQVALESSDVGALTSAVALKAPLASPALTGTPTLNGTALTGTFALALPAVGSFTYSGGNVTQDPEGHTYTYNGDGTVATEVFNGITRTYHWSAGVLTSVS